jgi:hypothetical protein
MAQARRNLEPKPSDQKVAGQLLGRPIGGMSEANYREIN